MGRAIRSVVLGLVLGGAALAQDPQGSPGLKGALEGQQGGPVDFQRLFRAADAPPVLACAHRGNHGPFLSRALDWATERKHGPASRAENSLAAIEGAIAAGVHVIEIDARPTKDGVLVLMHDDTIDRTTDGKGKVEDLTWAELQRVNLVPSGKIPTLEQALRLGKGRVVYDLDIKSNRVDLVVAAIQAADAHQGLFVYDTSRELLLRLKQLDPRVEVMPTAKTVAEALAHLQDQELRPRLVHMNGADLLVPELVQAARAAGVRLFVDALGVRDVFAPRGAFKRLIRLGAGVIETDRPDCLLRILRGPDADPDPLGE